MPCIEYLFNHRYRMIYVSKIILVFLIENIKKLKLFKIET